jgi:hypothetical protein
MRATPIAIACATALAGFGIFLLLTYHQDPLPGEEESISLQAAAATATSPSSLPPRVAPPGTREYKSTRYHFSLFYPQELTVTEHNEGGGAMTITFQNIENVEGFQIFIVPYSKPQVSEERFRQDEPSGVRESLSTIIIDGATGAAFYSSNPLLGPTREVWFVRGGFLFEVTSLKPYEAGLASILSTWEFI